MKGIILAGGKGTRLYPLTASVSKQLLPVYDKPMVYYPLATLKEGGIKDVCLISSPDHIDLFKALLGDGEQYRMSIEYRTQSKPAGIAEALIIAGDFIGNDSVALILGDNLIHGSVDVRIAFETFKRGATIFGYRVSNPSDYGVIGFGPTGLVESIEEKPEKPKSQYAVPGLYLYDSDVVERAKRLTPSKRGELEITDLNLSYLEDGLLNVVLMEPGAAWLDCGTPESLLEAANYVRTIQYRQGIMVGSPL